MEAGLTGESDSATPQISFVEQTRVVKVPVLRCAVLQALHDAGYEVPDTWGATYGLDKARDLVCQNKDMSADVVDTQLQGAGWFNHPSLDRKQAEAIRTAALSYCPNN